MQTVPAPITTAQPVPAPTPAPAPEADAEPTLEPTPTIVAKPTPEPKPVVDQERVKYEQLVALERRAPDKAIEGYLALSKGNTKWSAVALYAAGRLAFDRGNPKARTFLTKNMQAYLFGTGQAEDVDTSKKGSINW